MHTKFYLGNLKGKESLEDLDENIVLTCIFKEQVVGIELDSSDSKY
jgi:hypothetical protein